MVANEDPTHANDCILKLLHDKLTLAYLEYLSYQLQRSNAFNRLFQSEGPCLHNPKVEIEGLIKSISSDFLNVQYIKETAPKSIDPTNVQHHLLLNHVYIRLTTTATMTEMDCGAKQEDVQQFRNDCKNFFIESVIQIQKRLDPDSELLGMVECILPQKASARIPSSLSDIVRNRPYVSEIDPSQLDLE